MKYSSILILEMSNREIRSICGELYKAKVYRKESIRVEMLNGGHCNVPVDLIGKYQDAYEIETS